jgi:hypothetical protein
MAAGDILKESLLVVEKFTVKSNEDIEKGELVVDDGAGIVAATAALSVTGKVMMALEAHDYSEESTHIVPCVVIGCVEVQKVTGSGLARKGDKIMLSSTAGEVTKFVKGDAPTGGVSTYYTTDIEAGVQTAIDTNARVIGFAQETSADADTTQKMWLGVV